jgi:hypothetical protein
MEEWTSLLRWAHRHGMNIDAEALLVQVHNAGSAQALTLHSPLKKSCRSSKRVVSD